MSLKRPRMPQHQPGSITYGAHKLNVLLIDIFESGRTLFSGSGGYILFGSADIILGMGYFSALFQNQNGSNTGAFKSVSSSVIGLIISLTFWAAQVAGYRYLRNNWKSKWDWPMRGLFALTMFFAVVDALFDAALAGILIYHLPATMMIPPDRNLPWYLVTASFFALSLFGDVALVLFQGDHNENVSKLIKEGEERSRLAKAQGQAQSPSSMFGGGMSNAPLKQTPPPHSQGQQIAPNVVITSGSPSQAVMDHQRQVSEMMRAAEKAARQKQIEAQRRQVLGRFGQEADDDDDDEA